MMGFPQQPSNEIPKALNGVKSMHHQDIGIQFKTATHASKTTRHPPPANMMGKRLFAGVTSPGVTGTGVGTGAPGAGVGM